MERQFFHWITKRTLNELVQEGRLGFTQEKLEHHTAHFYYPRRHRYPRPLFCVRIMPSNYFYEVTRNGGYVLVTQNQNYPLPANTFAQRVKKRLALPVAVIQRLPDTALARFEKFHTGKG